MSQGDDNDERNYTSDTPISGYAHLGGFMSSRCARWRRSEDCSIEHQSMLFLGSE